MDLRTLLAILVLPAASATVSAADCSIAIRDGWVRLPPARTPMAAAFGRIENDCGMPATVVSASSPAFASVELHETRVVDGVSRMRHVHELRIPPEDAAVLKPGGLHLMLMHPHAALGEGSRVVVELELADGKRVLGEFEVRKLASP